MCDRAVCRVLLAYFDAANRSINLDAVPGIEVHPGVIELRRSHSGFSCTHTSIEAGRTTSVAGPGTKGREGQTENRLSEFPPALVHGSTAPAVLGGAQQGVARVNTSP